MEKCMNKGGKLHAKAIKQRAEEGNRCGKKRLVVK